jgi:hypothetical protein
MGSQGDPVSAVQIIRSRPRSLVSVCMVARSINYPSIKPPDKSSCKLREF